ncbi:glycosyl transferase family 1 [Salmonella enterica]|nr:glycosyl transferase family 1 [Salmonella enterica]
MTTLNIRVTTIDEINARFIATTEGDSSAGGHFLSFLSWDLLHDTLSPNRMAIIKSMTGIGEVSIREVARRVNRDVRAVHSDVKKLMAQGVIEKGEKGVIFPYDAVHFDFRIEHHAA